MPAKSNEPSPGEQFARVFAELRGILLPYESGLNVSRNREGDYCLETRGPGPRRVPLMFAAVRTNKKYVSFHLMPVYMRTMAMSPALEKRMQGKACFNFTAVDPALIDELRHLTRQGYEGWQQMKWVD
jgi:hypothetical protein